MLCVHSQMLVTMDMYTPPTIYFLYSQMLIIIVVSDRYVSTYPLVFLTVYLKKSSQH